LNDVGPVAKIVYTKDQKKSLTNTKVLCTWFITLLRGPTRHDKIRWPRYRCCKNPQEWLSVAKIVSFHLTLGGTVSCTLIPDGENCYRFQSDELQVV